MQQKIVFINDIHFKNRRDPRIPIFILFIDWCIQNKIAQLIILGDLFDAWISNNRYFVKQFHLVIQALEKAKTANIEIYYLEGNHDFFLEDFFGKKELALVSEKEFIFSIHGKNFLLAHGDQADEVFFSYHWLKKILRSSSFYTLFHLLPSWSTFLLTQFAAFLSRSKKRFYAKRTTARLPQIQERYRTFVQTWVQQIPDPIDFVVMGHSHVADSFLFSHQNRTISYLNLGDSRQTLQYILLDLTKEKINPEFLEFKNGTASL